MSRGCSGLFNWWVLVHLTGVFVFLLAHGVSVGVQFRLRKERDPQKVVALLELSGTSVQGFYMGLGILLVGGFAAAASGHLFGKTWIWASLGVLILTSGAMLGMARPYYRRVGVVARAMAGGSEAVTAEQFDGVLRESRSTSVAVIGLVGLAAILYMMVMKPTFGQGSGGGAPRAEGCRPSATIHVSASGDAFDTDCLAAPAGQEFDIVFDNEDTDQHNVAIYDGPDTLFRGDIFQGPKTETYHVPALEPGSYTFQCDVHTFMKGTFKVETVQPSPAGSGAGAPSASG